MPLAVFSRPGYCSRCQAWLGNRKASGTLEHGVALWHATAIGELLANASHFEGSSLRARFLASFRACVDVVTEGNQRAFARAAGGLDVRCLFPDARQSVATTRHALAHLPPPEYATDSSVGGRSHPLRRAFGTGK